MDYETNALRSLQRWLFAVLSAFPQSVPISEEDPTLVPTAWDVQRARSEPQDRPGAVVRALPVSVPSGSAYVVDMMQPYEGFIYPYGYEGNAVASDDEAVKVKTLVRRAVVAGGYGGSKAYRIPVYDYTGLEYNEPLDGDVEPYDFLVVDRGGFSIQTRPDPEADDLYTIQFDIRLRWEEQGDTSRFDGNILQSVPVKPQGEERQAP